MVIQMITVIDKISTKFPKAGQCKLLIKFFGTHYLWVDQITSFLRAYSLGGIENQMNSKNIVFSELEKQAEEKCLDKINILSKSKSNLKEIDENSWIHFSITIEFWIRFYCYLKKKYYLLVRLNLGRYIDLQINLTVFN